MGRSELTMLDGMNALIETDPVAALFAAQADTARLDQLVASGMPLEAISATVASGHWRKAAHNVVVASTGAMPKLQQEWAAVLACGRNAALCGRSAAAHQGLTGWDDGYIHVVVRRGIKPPSSAALPIKVHESRRFTPTSDVLPWSRPPMTRLERSVVDAASWMSHPRLGCGIAVAAVQQRLCSARELLAELDQLGRLRHRVPLQLVLRDVAGGPDALATINFANVCRRHNLPAPISQAARHDNTGRRRYLDVELTSRRGRRWRVEVDGAAHLIVGSYWKNRSGAEELIVRGESVLRIPSVALYLDESTVAAQLHHLLGD
jgi:hypothetical protein